MSIISIHRLAKSELASQVRGSSCSEKVSEVDPGASDHGLPQVCHQLKPTKVVLRFPFGFDGDNQAARHEDLVRYLQVHYLYETEPPDRSKVYTIKGWYNKL